jgi:hypothetical protein
MSEKEITTKADLFSFVEKHGVIVIDFYAE